MRQILGNELAASLKFSKKMNTGLRQGAMGIQAWLLAVLGCFCLAGCGSRSERVPPAKNAPNVELSIYADDQRVHRDKRTEAAATEEKRRLDEQMAVEQKKKEAAAAAEKRRTAERMEAEQKKKEAAAAIERQSRALEQLKQFPTAVSLIKGVSVGLGGPQTMPVSIGNVAIDDLIDLKLALAVPKGSRLKLIDTESVDGRSWTIVATKADLDDKQKVVILASIYQMAGDNKTAEGTLILEPNSLSSAHLKEYNSLFRSALLISASNPEEPQTRIIKQVNFVKPNPGQLASLTIAPGQSKATIDLGLPKFLTSDLGKQVLSVDDLTIAIEVVSPCTADGRPKETTIAVTEEMKDDSPPPADRKYRVPISASNAMEYYLAIDVQLQKNKLGGRLLYEANRNLPAQQKGFVENTYEILLKNAEDFEQAKQRLIATKRKGFDALCTYSSFPKSATVSPDAFSKYVQARLPDVLPELIENVLQERKVESIDALLQKAAADVARAIAAVPTTVQLLTSRGEPAGAPLRKQLTVLQREQTVAAQEAMNREYTPFVRRLFNVCEEHLDKFLNDKRAELLPLLTTPTKIQVKKIHTDAWHDGKKYEIPLVDVNAEPSDNGGQGTEAPAKAKFD